MELDGFGYWPWGRKDFFVAKEAFAVTKHKFQTRPHTSSLLTMYWQARWNVLGKLVGRSFQVPDCNYDQDEIYALEHLSVPRKLIYIPPQLDTIPEGLELLDRMHRQMRGGVGKPAVALSGITQRANRDGWLHIEADWRTPYTDTTTKGLEGILKDLAANVSEYIWVGQRPVSYIIGSHDSKELCDHYFDENSQVRLLWFLHDGRVLYVRFDSDGRLYFDWRWDHYNKFPHLGGRFEGVKL